MPSLSVPKLSVTRETSLEDVPSFGDMPRSTPRETASTSKHDEVNVNDSATKHTVASRPIVDTPSVPIIKTMSSAPSATTVKPAPLKAKNAAPPEDTRPGTPSSKPIPPLPTPSKAKPTPAFQTPPHVEETHTVTIPPHPMTQGAFPTIPAEQEKKTTDNSGEYGKPAPSARVVKNVTATPTRIVENVTPRPATAVRPVAEKTTPAMAPAASVVPTTPAIIPETTETQKPTAAPNMSVEDARESMTAPQPVPIGQAMKEDVTPAIPVENKPAMEEAAPPQPSGEKPDDMEAEPQAKPTTSQDPQPKTYTPMRVEGADATCTFDGHQIIILNHGRKARKSRITSTVTPIDSVIKAKLLWDDEDHAAFCLQILRKNGKPNKLPTHLEDVEANMYAFQAEDPGKAAVMVKAIDEAKPKTPQPLDADPYRRKHWYANPWMWTTILLILTTAAAWLFSTYTIQDGHVENRSMVSETMRDESNVSRRKAEEEADAADKLATLSAGSRIDLINQLENLGCSSAAATGAVDSSGRDWNAQAVEWLRDWMQGNPDAGQDTMLQALTVEGFDDEQASNAIQQVTESDSQSTTGDTQTDTDTAGSDIE